MVHSLTGSLALGCQRLWADLARQAVAAPVTQSEALAPADQSAASVDREVRASDRGISELECPCGDKWLVITITRHTKHNFGGRWDCTVGDLKMELWDSEHAGSGTLVFECQTSERGGPGEPAFRYTSNRPNYRYHNQYLIVARETYGLSPHDTTNYRTYDYSTAYLNKPRPGIAIYGSGSGVMDNRDGVLLHAGTSHTWSEGCIVLHRDGEVSGGAYRFNKDVSVNALLEMLEKIHNFAGSSKLPLSARVPRVRLRILESFNE